MDAMHYIQKDVGSFDLIFADPPYNFDKYDDLIEGIKSKNILNNNGDLIVEHGKQTNLEHIVGFQKTKTFGHVYFSFFTFDTDEKNRTAVFQALLTPSQKDTNMLLIRHLKYLTRLL